MPRLTQRLPKYRKHRATGQAIVALDGRDHYLGPHGTVASKLEYDRLCREHIVSGGAERDELWLTVGGALIAGWWGDMRGVSLAL